MNERELSRDEQKVVQVGTTDILNNGELIRNSPAPAVMVENQSALTGLVDYPAGTIAYTAGFKAMWQKSAAGTWVSLM